MWGLMLRLQGDRVDASIPGWLLNATATHAAIELGRCAAIELASNPEAYGFDPGAVYSILVQTWDRATTDIRSVAFGRNVSGHSAVGLLLDYYYMQAQGYHDLRRAAVALPRWASRSDRVVWRGSVTGDNTIVAPEDLPRMRLALACRDWTDADVGLIGVHPTMNNGRPTGLLDAFVTSHGLRRGRWDMIDFGRHKYLIDIDGHANAWGFLEKLIVGSCVLKVESPYEQWFYDRIEPWRHYVPIKADLSDLREIVSWCRDNDDHCRWIAANGARLAASLTVERELPRTCQALMAAAHMRRLAARPARRDAETTPLFLLENATHVAERLGAVDQAVDAYTRLIDADPDRAGSLMRRHELLRERGDFAGAQADMERAIAADPENAEAAFRLAQFFALIGRDIAAVHLLERTMALAPDRGEVRIFLARSCLKLDWLDKAFWAVRDLPDDLPGWWADLRREVLDTYVAYRKHAFAILRARRSTGVSSPEHRLELALKLLALGRVRVAWRLVQGASERDPASFAPHDLAGEIIARRSGPADALLHYCSLTAETVAADRYVPKRAELLFDLGRYDEVLKIVDRQASVAEESRLRPIVAFSTIMLSRPSELISYCREWMDRSPLDMHPAEMVCAAQPIAALPIASRIGSPTKLVLGQYWDDEAIPEDVQEIMNSWLDMHAGLRRHIYHAGSARDFLLAECDTDTVRAFDHCQDRAARAAFFRLAWLYRGGGLWIDANQRCIRSVEPILADVVSASITAVRSGHITGYLQDALIGARAGSTLIETALRTSTAMILQAVERGEAFWAWRAVGPGLLTYVVAETICRLGARDALLLAPTTYDSFATTASFEAAASRRP